MPRIVDLSVPLEESPSEPMRPEIEHHDHKTGSLTMQAFFNCGEKDLPGGLGWSDDKVTANTHAGTHLDAPWHFSPTSEGKPAKTIDQIPLEWCYADGVVLDFRRKPDGYGITAADIEAELKRIKYKIKPFDLVMIETGADKLWGSPEYFLKGCGMTRESTLCLIDQGVKIMGTDAWGFDRPFPAIAKDFAATKDRRVIWAAHFTGIEREYLHIEKLANLDKLPAAGATLYVNPMLIRDGTGAPARVFARFSE